MRKLPWFPFYGQDFFGDPEVGLMTYEEIGVYVKLLSHAWRAGSIPADPGKLQRLLRVTAKDLERVWPALEPCWEPGPEPGTLVNPRQERERAITQERYEQKVEAAAKGRAVLAAKHSAKHSGEFSGETSGEFSAEDSGENANENADEPSSEDSYEPSNTQYTGTSSSSSQQEDVDSHSHSADAESWNERLAPFCRSVGGADQIGNWLAFWRSCGAADSEENTEDAAGICWGLRWLADKGQLEEVWGIRKGDTMKPGVLRSLRADILTNRAREAFQRHSPNEGAALVRALTKGGER